ncbi:hypothetical protein BG006_000912 [Podila minutissima]|uniref:Uncharacterized protein n=1 Tax=Podila minutissima TaxID=64525 RepID=A0A9P5SBE1_9FUNG|nr:hypothetical protein BG006_000912 [Podila minutissima]
MPSYMRVNSLYVNDHWIPKSPVRNPQELIGFDYNDGIFYDDNIERGYLHKEVDGDGDDKN